MHALQLCSEVRACITVTSFVLTVECDVTRTCLLTWHCPICLLGHYHSLMWHLGYLRLNSDSVCCECAWPIGFTAVANSRLHLRGFLSKWPDSESMSERRWWISCCLRSYKQQDLFAVSAQCDTQASMWRCQFNQMTVRCHILASDSGAQ